MDLTRASVALCAEGTQAEFGGRLDEARGLYARAWEVAGDDYDRTVAAHYVAHLESDPAEQLRWNEFALQHALCADAASVAPFMGSLYVNLGHSHELTGDPDKAAEFYELAAQHGVVHQPE
ncbi:MAG: hypothetical protein FDZ75_02610 [Actinobacteria bacterium]|nr:MAG: hypothetical protein FDZ75_02610 [Actinomycetota bacterium]